MKFSLTKQDDQKSGDSAYQDAGTIIGVSVKITGDLVSEGDIQVDGVMEGNLKTGRSVVVGSTAQIKGKIFAARVIISGSVNADIIATEELQILSTGKVFGNIQFKTLGIEPGAIFVGKSEMLSSDSFDESENTMIELPKNGEKSYLEE